MHDGGVRRADLMKNVAPDEYQVRREFNHLIQRPRERLRYVGFTLIEAARSQPLILAEAKVKVGKMDEAQNRLERGLATQNFGALTGCTGDSWLSSGAYRKV